MMRNLCIVLALILGIGSALAALVIHVDHNITNWCILDYPREIVGGNIVYCDDPADNLYTLDFEGHKRYDNVGCFDTMRVTREEYKRWIRSN